MCGFIISTLEIPSQAEKFIKNRGPDKVGKLKYQNFNFHHYLLQITGKPTTQPIINFEREIILIFNGEIYNYLEINPESKSDGYSIIVAYIKYGKNFINYLDGEFAIVLFDFKNNYLFLSSDIFKTKPLFYYINPQNKEVVISSYISPIKLIKPNLVLDQETNKIKEIFPNKLLIFNLTTLELIEEKQIYQFDLEQKKDNYLDWIIAFEKAVLKRYPDNQLPIIFLSSGLDSGGIACCLEKYQKKFLAYTFSKNENLEIIKKRKEIHQNKMVLVNMTSQEDQRWYQYLQKNCEEMLFKWEYTPNHQGITLGSIKGKSYIFDLVKKNNPKIKVAYSGIGGDEIMATNQYYDLPNKGQPSYFPENLEEIFPWKNFFQGSMNNYLKGDEYVGGCFGFETRYPYLDKDLVQEFLWLKPELKNQCQINNQSYYIKPALLNYLIKNNYPCAHQKLGFNV